MLRRLNLIWVYLWQCFAPQDQRERLGVLWIFLEPIGQMAVLMLIFTLIGRNAPYGRSFAVFLIAGLAMVTLFTRTSQLTMNAVKALSKENRFPGAGMFQDAIARVIFTTIIVSISTGSVLLGVAIFNRVETTPQHWDAVIGAVTLTAFLAFGVGLLRAYFVRRLSIVDRIYTIAARALIFISGVFYMPSFLPPQLREPLSWNPVAHGVEFLRLGIYREYPTTVLDVEFLFVSALGATAFGMTLLWRSRAEIMG